MSDMYAISFAIFGIIFMMGCLVIVVGFCLFLGTLWNLAELAAKANNSNVDEATKNGGAFLVFILVMGLAFIVAKGSNQKLMDAEKALVEKTENK